MNLQQILTLIADLARAAATASGQHAAGELQSDGLNMRAHLSDEQKQAVQTLAEQCQQSPQPPAQPWTMHGSGGETVTLHETETADHGAGDAGKP